MPIKVVHEMPRTGQRKGKSLHRSQAASPSSNAPNSWQPPRRPGVLLYSRNLASGCVPRGAGRSEPAGRLTPRGPLSKCITTRSAFLEKALRERHDGARGRWTKARAAGDALEFCTAMYTQLERQPRVEVKKEIELQNTMFEPRPNSNKVLRSNAFEFASSVRKQRCRPVKIVQLKRSLSWDFFARAS